MATKEAKTWGIALSALVVSGALLLWALSAPSEGAAPAADSTDEAPPPRAAQPAAPARPIPSAAKTPVPSSPKPATPKTPSPSEAQRASSDDLFAGPMPDFMVDLHARVLDKKRLGAPMQKQLYDYGQAHKNDARPQLILAWDAVNREWDGIAVQMYRIAYQADPRAANDSRMLPDLLRIASQSQPERVEYRDTLELMRKAYGPNARPAIEAELEELNATGELARAERLSTLRDDLMAP